ncbi:universal stress protein [Halomarina pelagica]|uniref:universal stress protein n=1 Tax=Halomarina pelagica TaxID=2961599 RepID=UPI0020C48827|nr:universal stress protein [Halomarina sp. BND7]
MYETILVPTDGSDGANRAVEHALHLAERDGASLHVIFVVDVDRYGEPALSSAEIVIDELEDEGHDLVEGVAARADNRGVEATTRCCHGTPDSEIVGYADAIGADLIVMGYQGRSHRTKIGSVANRVVQHAERPVMTV